MNILLTLLFLVLIIVFWALFGKGDSITEQEEKELPDKIFRKRAADLEIEKKFPDLTERPRRRKTDPETIESIEDLDGEYNLPYKVDEIISEASRFGIYKRTLVNSEIYAKRRDFPTAISLYEGVNTRINDTNTNYKIEANINYLKKYKEYHEEKKREQEDIKRQYQHRKSSEIKFSIDGPISIPEKIHIGISPQVQKLSGKPEIDINKLVDDITNRLSEKILLLKDGKYPDEDIDIDALKEEIKRLEEKIKNMVSESEEISKEMGVDPALLKKNLNQISELKNEINILNNRINNLTEPVKIGSSKRTPILTEARYDTPIPITFDTKPILEILENIPKLTPSEPKVLDFPAPKKPADTDLQKGKTEKDDTIKKETIKREEKLKEEEEEFKLLSEHQEEEEIDDLAYDFSDDDVFQKILTDDKKGEIGAFEILGDKKEESEYSYDLTDDEFEKKRREEEEFYGKFLRHEKRIKKELPILKVTYDFSRLPDEFSLARDKNILEYSFYKYKPMLEKAEEFLKKRMVKDAINYYKVVMSQNIPPEFKTMIRRNINDLIEYLEKYLASG